MTVRDRRVLEKILEEVRIGIDIFGSPTFEEFVNNELLRRATCMTLINIGELVKSLCDDTRTSYPQILWKNIAGMRDVAAHKYKTLEIEDVYDTVKNDFPTLKTQLEEILSK